MDAPGRPPPRPESAQPPRVLPGWPPPRPEPVEPPRVLYRCRTPTDFLCPCGTVARRLKKLGIEHRTERVAWRKRDRPEVVELTGERFVPVLVDGEEVISDSRRILEYLDYRQESKGPAPPPAPGTIEGDV
jgi:hypothetical protein